MNLYNTIEIIKAKAKYGSIFLEEYEDGQLFICRTPTTGEIDSWLKVCKKLESNAIMMAMSIAYITQVYPSYKMPEDIAVKLGDKIMSDVPVNNDDLKKMYESSANDIGAVSFIVYDMWRITGVNPTELKKLTLDELMEMYKISCVISDKTPSFINPEEKPKEKIGEPTQEEIDNILNAKSKMSSMENILDKIDFSIVDSEDPPFMIGK